MDISPASSGPDAPTGLILFEPRLPDVTRVHYYRAGSAGSRMAPDVLDRAFATTAPQVLHLVGITPALGRAPPTHALHLARERETTVCLDVNHRSRLWTADQASAVLRDWIPYVDILISSADELSLCLPPGSPADITVQAGQLPAAGVTEIVETRPGRRHLLYAPAAPPHQPTPVPPAPRRRRLAAPARRTRTSRGPGRCR
ncbi:hypothetical protein [Streptomyces sp. WAC 06783]|uniref:hypothetical protein n=1 Tax=Streptomyces sp. WAC 06783 TaxID=2203211 RepID=UPI002899949D|nr:hypothetical protein [Streptomyces sp. WAC 06783]